MSRWADVQAWWRPAGQADTRPTVNRRSSRMLRVNSASDAMNASTALGSNFGNAGPGVGAAGEPGRETSHCGRPPVAPRWRLRRFRALEA